MQRIIVIGSGGSGKSELSRRIGEILGIEVIHLDRVYWQPNWTEPPKDEWKETVEDLVKRESWAMDGNFRGTMEIRVAAADTIVFLDLPRVLCVWRAVKRSVKYPNQTRPDMGVGCREKIDLEFLQWIWNFPRDSKPLIMEILRRCDDTKSIYVLKSRREVEAFVQDIGRR
jgi:adenylate kinase family enzyme